MSTVAATRSKTYDIVYIAVFAVIMAICSWISIPAAVPFTLQTFGVFIAVGILGGKRGTLSVLVFILLGAIGVPVFAGFSGGIGVLAGTTGGYIIGFLFSALVMWAMEKTSWQKSSDADCFYDRRTDCLLCIWYCMVYDRLQQSKRSCWSGNRSWMVRDSVHHSGYYQNRTCLWTFQKAS